MKDVSHAFFIDDSGTKEYADNPSQYGSGKSRHFVFGGLFMTTAEAGQMTSRIMQLKMRFFGDDVVEIKSNWLRRPDEREEHYLRPYRITNDELDDFVEEYYGLLRRADFKMLASVIDKLHMQEKYPDPWYPPAVAYEILLQRIEKDMRRKTGGLATIKIDDMRGGTPAGNEYKENLKRQHKQLLRHGSNLNRSFSFSRIAPRVKFADSETHHLVQAADVVAYNIYRQFTSNPDDWEDDSIDKLRPYVYLKRLLPKFRMSSNRRIQGYGLIKFPNRNRRQWRLVKD